MLALAGVMAVSACGSQALAAGAASDVAGTYKIDTAEPLALTDGPDPATCWSLTSGDLVTIAEAAPDRLVVTLPTGRAWQLQPLPPDTDDTSVRYTSKWIGIDADWATSRQGSIVEFYEGGGGGSAYILAKLQYDMEPPFKGCEIHVSAIRSEEEAGTPTPTPAPTGQGLGVSLACQHDFDEEGRIECTATPTQPADAYEWSVDGTVQTGTTGPELTGEVLPGSHTISVVARDTVNGLRSEPDSLTFTTSAGDGIGGGGPWVTLLAGLAGLGALAAGASAVRRRRRRAGGDEPADVPTAAGGIPGDGEPAAAPSTPRPTGPPEPQRLATPGPPSRPPESLVPAAGTAAASKQAATAVAGRTTRPSSKPKPGPFHAPPKQKRQTKDELVMYADPGPHVLRGNARDEEVVGISALRTRDGVTTDATDEIKALKLVVSDEKKLSLRASQGRFNVVVRGMNVGSEPALVTVTVEGTTLVGQATPTTFQVLVRPVPWELELKATKQGFHDGSVTLTLPYSCARFHGSIESRDLTKLVGDAPDGPIADARCVASMRVDGGDWSSPRQLRTRSDGTFWFAIPAEVVAAFGVEVPDHEMHPALRLHASPEIKDALRGYRVALDGLQAELGKAADVGAYQQPIRDCDSYPKTFLEQLRTKEEREYDWLLGAVHLLRAGITFADSHRRDFRDQRVLLEMAARDAFERLFDVLTDLIPVVGGLVDWVRGAPMAGSLPFLLAKASALLKRIPGGTFVLKGILYVLEGVRAIMGIVMGLVQLLADLMVAVAREHGFEAKELVGVIRRMGSDYARQQAAGRTGGPGGVEDDIAGLFGVLAKGMWVLVQCLAWALSGLFLLLAGGMARLVTATLEYGGSAATLAEQLEEYLGDWAKNTYDRAGRYMDSMQSRDLKQGAVVPKPSGRDLCDLILDEVRTVRDLDARCAPALAAAHRQSVALRVPGTWREGISRNVQQYVRLETEREEWYVKGGTSYGFVQYAEFVDRVGKAVTRIVQGICFVASVLYAQAARVALAAAKKAELGEGWSLAADHQKAAKKDANATEYAGRFETFGDAASLIFVKGPIFGLALAHLFNILAIASASIESLYDYEVEGGLE